MSRKNLIYLILFLNIFSSFSQKPKTDANIIGHVVSDGRHIPFASVHLKGTAIGTACDQTGHYYLVHVPAGNFTIVASAIGYKTKELFIKTEEGRTMEVKFELEPDLLNLQEVVVSSDRNARKRNDAPVIVNTITPALFRSTQSVTISEGLNFCPGLRIENNCQNCGFTQLRMNGMEGPYTQILINSRPVFSGLAGVYGLELIPSGMIERIEVVRGGGSSLYGSNAIAGTVNLILKDPVSNSYEAGITSGLTGVGLKTAGKPSPDHSFSFNSTLVSDDQKTGVAFYGFARDRKMFDANHDGFTEISPLKNSTIGSRFFHRTGYRSKLAVDYFNIKEERAGGNRHDFPLHERDIAEAVKHDLHAGAVSYEKFFREHDLFSAFASVQGLNRDSYYGANRSLKGYGNTKDLTYNAGAQYKVYLGNSSVLTGMETIGGSLMDKKLGYPDYENAVILNNEIAEVPHIPNVMVANQTLRTTGVFTQYEIDLERAKIAVGARYDHYRVQDKQVDDSGKNGNVFSPRVSFLYVINPYLKARLSYAQGYRAPQIFDEDLHIETSGSRQVININDPGLKQETSHSYITSIDINNDFGKTSFGLLAEGFYTYLINPFVNEIGTPDESGIVYYNRVNAEDGAVVKGINLECKIQPKGIFSFASGFTLQKSEYSKAQEFDERRFFRSPGSYGFFTFERSLFKAFDLSATGIYTGKMLVPYFGPESDPENGELRTSKPFFDLGTRISCSIKLNGSKLQIYGGIKNIFNSYQSDFDTGIDRDPAYMYGPVLPRMIYLGLKAGNMLR